MIIGISIAIAIFAWAFVGLYALDLLPKNISKHFDDPAERTAWIVRGLAGLSVLTGFLVFRFAKKTGFWFGLWPDMISIGIAVLIIDELNRLRSEQELKKQLFLQIRFSSNAFALDALQLVRNMGWFDEIICPEANLNRAHLNEANLYEANLAGADLRNACLDGADLRRSNLAGANLESASLKGAWMNDANLDDAILPYANLENAIMWGVSLREADLKGVCLVKAALFKSNLQGADLTAADLQNADLNSVNLEDSNLTSARLMNAFLWRSTLAQAILVSADLENAELSKTDLRQTDLYRTNFKNARLGSADLRSAILESTNFEGATLADAILDRAVYSDDTQWPKDFDFRAAGAIPPRDMTEEEKGEHRINRPAAWNNKWQAKAEKHPWRIRNNQERLD